MNNATNGKPQYKGLRSEEAQQRALQYGPNQITDREHRGWADTLRGIATEPMFLLLLVAAAIYLLLGDLGEGLLLAFFAVVTVSLVIFQEHRSARALDALRELAAPQVRVIRDAQVQRIAAAALVPGDLFLLSEGERVAADALLREAGALAVDESLLTGESVPVSKQTAAADALWNNPVPGGENLPAVFAGTLVVAGHGIAEVMATGQRTRIGQIGVSLAVIETAATPLQQQLHRLVRVFGAAALVSCVVLAAWYGWSRGDWLQGLLSAIALGMAMLPEEFPMVLAVFLALGAWRLARSKVLARRAAVIETLGSATVLCVDKTGTLTENRMRLRRLVTAEADVDVATEAALPEAVHPLLEFALLASRRGSADPMDRAVLVCADRSLADTEHLHPDWSLQREYPLSPALLAMSHAWYDDAGRTQIAAKGAPEAVADLCHLAAAQRAELLDRVQQLAAQGLRVLAVAHGRTQDSADPAALAADQRDYVFTLLGLLAFEDPLRPTVAAAVAQAHRAGIVVAMITGDHAATARAIAAAAGIDTTAGVLTGNEIRQLDDVALSQALRRVRVFARVLPEQKLRLVQALAANGETVAMTGDGVNDAPALKAAHIGIAMGVRGTDVAREAAGVVLLDEDFGRIVNAVRMGRRISDNLRHVMTYITAIHVPIAGLALLPVLLGLPPLLMPAHVVLTEMVIDPACSLVFEGVPDDPRLMQRPPRRADQTVISAPMLWRGVMQGLGLLLAVLVLYVSALRLGLSADEARSLSIVALTAGNLMLVWMNATANFGWRALWSAGFGAFWGVAAFATTALTLAFAVPALRGLLHFAVLPIPMVAAAIAIGLISAAATAALTRGKPAAA